MKKFFTITCLVASILPMGTLNLAAQNTHDSRGLIVLPASTGNGEMVSWRLYGSDDDYTTFEVLRDGNSIASVSDRTCYVDANGSASNHYQIVTRHKGISVDTTEAVSPWSTFYIQLPLDRPAGGSTASSSYTYSPNDCSAADVDGDGEYEIVLKWDPTNSKDNSFSGITGNTIFDCYKLDGTRLWRIDLGKNIRAGAHYSPFLFYDFNGDGLAELICKTAPGSIDGTGAYVTNAATDETILQADNSATYFNSSGYIKEGPEYLTVFDGQTGKAIHTIWYRPNRAGTFDCVASYPSSSSFWGDSYANRSERYLACVAHLGDEDSTSSAVFGRGYYTRAYLWAVDFDGKSLSTRWVHCSVSSRLVIHYDADDNMTTKSYTTNTAGNSGSKTVYGNGNHNLSVADVDNDGRDEIIYGSAAVDDDGSLLYATGYGHGDAMHVSDLIPSRPGLEVFEVHEGSPYGWDIHDAATGEIILSATGESDNGRGLAADLSSDYEGFEFCSANDRQIRNATSGDVISTNSTSVNFRVYWDDDAYDELLDDKKIDKWNGDGTSRLESLYNYGNSQDCNSTKHTPNLQADILGDWREEIVLWDNSDSCHLNIFSSNIPTKLRVPTLMDDHVYRMGVAWQNTAYNQPPHLSYYLPNQFVTSYQSLTGASFEQTVALGDSMETIVCHWRNCSTPFLLKTILPNGTVKYGAADGFSYSVNSSESIFTLSGKPDSIGDYYFILRSGANVIDDTRTTDTIKIHCVDSSVGISLPTMEDKPYELSSAIFTDDISLSSSLPDRDLWLTLYSESGAMVCNGVVRSSSRMTFNCPNGLSKGVYLLKIDDRNGHKQYFKLLKQ